VAHGEGSAALAASDVTMVAVTLARLSPNDGGPGDAMVADLARDLSGDLAARYLDLSTGWTAVMDGPNTPDPAVTLSTSSATQAVVSSVGGPGCGCNAQVLSIPLQATYPCQGTTLEFGYSTSAAPNAFGFNNTASLFVGFFLSGASVGSFSASEQTGHSNCALLFNDTFPSTPQIHEGQNQIALGSLTSAVDGSCNGSFDRIDVHMQGYGCAATDTSTTNLSSLRLY
jgi:hypothetical protein